MVVADELRAQAIKSVDKGNFDDAGTLLDRAASISQDPRLASMAELVKSFQAQCRTLAQERHKLFEEEVGNVHLLLDHKMDSYAIDAAKDAYPYADDKDAFRHETWVDSLIKESAAGAAQYDDQGLWLRALRVYSDLSVLEPTNPMWRDKLKLTARRVRLLMIYTPDQLKKLQAIEKQDREAADKLLEATTQPTVAQAKVPGSAAPNDVPVIKGGLLSGVGVNKLIANGVPASQPSTRPADADSATTQPDLADETGVEDTNIDWREVTKGIQFDMLLDALELAQGQYYRDVTYQGLMGGGLTGLKTVLTTSGMEEAFPGLADQGKKDEFLHAIESAEQDLAKAKDATQDSAKDLLWETLNHLTDVNKRTVQLPEGVFVSEFADGAFSVLDPFSTVIWPYDLSEFEKQTQGDFGGVGIQIRNNKAGDLMVVEPLPDTPADRAGIQPDDIITRINGNNAKKISLDHAVRTITGVPGTTVTLTIRNTAGTEKDYVLRREIIKVGSIKGYLPLPGGKWDYFIDPQAKIADIRLTNFTKTTSEDLDSALEELKGRGARGIILDLRNNPGGLLQAATEVVNKFISGGVIVKTHADRTPSVNPPTEADARPEDMQTDLPLVVLVNPLSASASEIVSGALKDWRRATIVGERTFGKGSVQMLFPLDSKEAYLKLTTSHYYLPLGRCIHREEDSQTWGVDPDASVVMTPVEDGDLIEMRQELDIRRPAGVRPATTQPTPKELLKIDPQLSAALLILRLQLSVPDTASVSAQR
jgi:carboxyl-terminal processing protease